MPIDKDKWGGSSKLLLGKGEQSQITAGCYMVKNHKFIGLFQTVFYYWIRIVLFALFQIFCIGLVFLGIALADTPSSPNQAASCRQPGHGRFQM